MRCVNGHNAEKSPEGMIYCEDKDCFCGWNNNQYLGDWRPSWVTKEGE